MTKAGWCVKSMQVYSRPARLGAITAAPADPLRRKLALVSGKFFSGKNPPPSLCLLLAISGRRRADFVLVLHRALPDLQRMKLCYSAAASSAPRSVFPWCD